MLQDDPHPPHNFPVYGRIDVVIIIFINFFGGYKLYLSFSFNSAYKFIFN